MSLQFGLIYEFPLLILADSARVDDDDFSLPSSLGNYNYPYFQIYRRSVLLSVWSILYWRILFLMVVVAPLTVLLTKSNSVVCVRSFYIASNLLLKSSILLSISLNIVDSTSALGEDTSLEGPWNGAFVFMRFQSRNSCWCSIYDGFGSLRGVGVFPCMAGQRQFRARRERNLFRRF